MVAVTSEHQVANLALGIVGQRQFLDSLDEPTTEAQVAKTFFASTRNEVLAAYRWRFATKRAVLALTTEERSGWGYAYAAPANMLVAQYIWSGDRAPGAGDAVAFAKELNDAATGHLILTDMAEAELVYTMELKTVALWPPHFVKTLAAQLAVYLAGALPVKPELMAPLQRSAQMALQTAAAIDANEAQRDADADAESVRVR